MPAFGLENWITGEAKEQLINKWDRLWSEIRLEAV